MLTTDEENRKRGCEELRLLYSTVVGDIAFFKNQQWRVTNYGLLIYAVIVAIPKILHNELSFIEYYVLYIIAFIILSIGWCLIGSLEKALKKGRCRLMETRKQFSNTFMTAWQCGKTAEQEPDRPEEKPSLLWLFRSIFVLGFLVVCWLLSRMMGMP